MPFSKSADPLPNFGTLVRTEEPPSPPPTRGRINMKRNATIIQDSRNNNRPSTTRGDDQHEENGVWFWVNKNGFPVDDMTWSRMWDHVAKIHPDGYKMVSTIRGNADNPQIPVPQAPLNFSPTLSVPERIEKIQTYMNTLQYNHTGTQFYEIRKNRPISGLMEVAKDMIREALPIKCLEAIILGLFLTNGMMGVERFPIGFKSAFGGNFHRHVVLGIYHGGRYGALGMSRRDDLMYKPVIFKTLSELILDYEKAYKKYWHDVKKIKLGLPVPHDPHSYEFVQWKTVTMTRSKLSQQELIKEVDSHAKEIRSKSRSWSVPQSMSPRKSMSFVELDTARHKYQSTSSSQNTSLGQAAKIYTGTSTSISSSVTKKKDSTDAVEYQIRI